MTTPMKAPLLSPAIFSSLGSFWMTFVSEADGCAADVLEDVSLASVAVAREDASGPIRVQ